MICDIGDKAGRAIMRVGKSSNSAFRVSRPTVDRDAPFVASRALVVLDQLWSRPRMAGTSNRNRSNDLDEIWTRL
jgi:hypothetical protein